MAGEHGASRRSAPLAAEASAAIPAPLKTRLVAGRGSGALVGDDGHGRRRARGRGGPGPSGDETVRTDEREHGGSPGSDDHGTATEPGDDHSGDGSGATTDDHSGSDNSGPGGGGTSGSDDSLSLMQTTTTTDDSLSSNSGPSSSSGSGSSGSGSSGPGSGGTDDFTSTSGSDH